MWTRVSLLVVVGALPACRADDSRKATDEPARQSTTQAEQTEQATSKQTGPEIEQTPEATRQLQDWAAGFLGSDEEHAGGFGSTGVVLGKRVADVEKHLGVAAEWKGSVAELKLAGSGGEGVQFTLYTAGGVSDQAGGPFDADVANEPRVIKGVRFTLPFKGPAQRAALFSAIERRFGEAWTQRRIPEHHNTPAFELHLYRFERHPLVIVAEASDWLFEIFMRADESVPPQGLSTTAGPSRLRGRQ